jgi:hypothetical protein
LTYADRSTARSAACTKYIDPKIPGHKEHPDELLAAQSAVQVLQNALKAKKGFKPARRLSAQDLGDINGSLLREPLDIA